MSANKAGANAGSAVDDLRDDIAHTRADLGETVVALKGKADVKSRVADSARQVKARGDEAVEQVGESARTHPARWGAVATAFLAAVAALGALRWRRARNTPKSRAQRVWREVKGGAQDVKEDVKSRVREVKKDAQGRVREVKKEARGRVREVKKEAQGRARQVKGRFGK